MGKTATPYRRKVQTYEQLQQVAKTYYKDKNMCTVISLAIGCKVSYGKAYHTLRRLGRRHGKGVTMPLLCKAYLVLGYTWQHIDRQHYPKTVGSFERYNAWPDVVIETSGHVLTTDSDGNVQDWTQGRRHRIVNIYRIVEA